MATNDEKKSAAGARRVAAEDRRNRNSHPPGSGPEAGRQSRIARDRLEARDRIKRQGPLSGAHSVAEIANGPK
jgi:hypothetical protein